MKRSGLLKLPFFISICFLIFTAFAHAEGLAYISRNGEPIKVFLKDFSNESGQSQINAAEFMKEAEKALINRKSVKFAVVKSPQDSDVQISAVIKSYEYLEKDPIRPSTTATMILDAVTTENFVEMAAEFTVIDTKSGNTVWRDTIKAYVKRMMTPAESVPAICDKVSRTFLWKAFGKGDR